MRAASPEPVSARRRTRGGMGGGGSPATKRDVHRAEAWEAALRLLAMRARSTQEVRQLLARRGYPPDESEAVIARLTSAKFLDDLDFARTWVRSRALRQAVAPGRLARELRAKGIGEVEISAALVDVSAEPSVREIALEAAARKLRALQGLDPAIARRRLAAHLSRRGFDADVILALCREHFPGASDPDEEP